IAIERVSRRPIEGVARACLPKVPVSCDPQKGRRESRRICRHIGDRIGTVEAQINRCFRAELNLGGCEREGVDRISTAPIYQLSCFNDTRSHLPVASEGSRIERRSQYHNPKQARVSRPKLNRGISTKAVPG